MNHLTNSFPTGRPSPHQRRRNPAVSVLCHAIVLGALAAARGNAAGPLDSWQNRTPTTNTNHLSGVVHGNGRFVAVGYGGTVLYSPDGATWNLAPRVTSKDLYAVTFGDGLFVAGGQDRILLTSADGVTWVSHPASQLATLFCGTYGNGTHLFAGTSRVVESTGDGVWSTHLQPADQVFDGLTFGKGKFVAVAHHADTYAPKIYTSTDGLGWTARNPKTAESLAGVAQGGGLFVAVGDNGAITTSPDGVTWTAHRIITTNTLWGVNYGDNTFVAAGWAGALYSSTNGANWTPRSSGTSHALYSVGYGGNTFVAVGRHGIILQSGRMTGGGSPVVISPPIRAGGTVTFQFTGALGQTYQVQASTDFKSWASLTNLICTGSPVSCAFAGQTMARRFYRVVQP